MRAESWVKEADSQGAFLLVGGDREGPLLKSTLFSNIATDIKTMSDEIFAPVVNLCRFDELSDAIDELNETPYGLANGIFTNDLNAGLNAAKCLRVGGVHINETSWSCVDVMSCGDCKDSGFGREGPYFVVKQLTEERLVTINTA